MVLAVLVGNGSQLCAMVGVTLGALPSIQLFCNSPCLLDIFSLCFARFSVTFEQGIASNGDDGLLDLLRRVRRPFPWRTEYVLTPRHLESPDTSPAGCMGLWAG